MQILKINWKELKMKNFFKIFSVFLLSLSLSGCGGTAGHAFLEKMSKEEIEKNLIVGKTTKEDVHKAFGQPSDTKFKDNGNEQWTYTFQRSDVKGSTFIPVVNWFHRGTDDQIKTLRITFDTKGILVKHSFSSFTGETVVGLGR